MPETTRTFVALPVPEANIAALGRLRAKLEPELSGARWVESHNLHLTLAFLGDVEAADLADVCRAAVEVAADFEPFELRVEGVGAFPDARRPRVVWAGLTGDGVARLRDLNQALVQAMRRLGYPPDERFSPHITLARFRAERRPPRDATQTLEPFRSWSGGRFTATEVVVYSSTLHPKGPIYTPMARGPLIGGGGA